MSGIRWVAIVVVAGMALSLVGTVLGAWWVPFPTGVAIGVALTRARWSLPAGALAGLVAWTVPLVTTQLQYDLGSTATSLAAIMGFNGAATISVALTVLVGALLGLSGAWTGSAARDLYRDVAPAIGGRETR